ncbi:predicted protein [Plenodomus lingam JN3]|uniref:Uncharacterized protein n=1 Tax=Leptosphaeria maculans (strain JN3 / isolate v23.1.3 / race Av1-4-5-6-7-8) TaxID=985895 RepID=E4ZFT4_LEPMJ|nr:predicted protein [Plenodomus lingam JN3]CBX90154.1 predicted protein [Plenodomus lingam JN3]
MPQPAAAQESRSKPYDHRETRGSLGEDGGVRGWWCTRMEYNVHVYRMLYRVP